MITAISNTSTTTAHVKEIKKVSVNIICFTTFERRVHRDVLITAYTEMKKGHLPYLVEQHYNIPYSEESQAFFYHLWYNWINLQKGVVGFVCFIQD